MIYKLSKIIINRIKSSEIIKGFASNTFWSLVSKGLSVLVTLFCTNTLSQGAFGEFGYLKNTLDLILVICAGNFASIGIKFAAESMTSKKSLKRLVLLIVFTLTISIIICLVTVLMPWQLMQGFFESEIVVHYIRIIALLLPLFIIQPLITSILKGYKEFNLVGIYEASSGLFFLIIVIIGVSIAGGLGAIWGLLIYHSISSIAGIIILFVYNRRHGYLGEIDEIKSESRCLYHMIFPVFVMSFVDVPLQWFAQTEIARHGTYALVGSMTVIAQIRYIVQMLPTFFYSSFTPFVSILYTENKNIEYFEKFSKLSRLLFYLSAALIPVLIMTGKLLLSVFNRVYVSNYDAYIIAIIALPLHLYCAFYKLNMMIREHQTSIMIMTLISGALFVFFLYIFFYYGFNILISFFLAQIVQYMFQVLFGHTVYLKDKKLSYRH